jgi:hypothetical protein
MEGVDIVVVSEAKSMEQRLARYGLDLQKSALVGVRYA